MTVTDYDFKIGAPVLTAEGEVGRLKYVVVDPHAEVVTDLVVERGRLLRRNIVVPTGWGRTRRSPHASPPSSLKIPARRWRRRCQQQWQHGDLDRAGAIRRSATGRGTDRMCCTKCGACH